MPPSSSFLLQELGEFDLPAELTLPPLQGEALRRYAEQQSLGMVASIEFVRELTEQDLLEIEAHPMALAARPAIANLRYLHHQVAKLLVKGESDVNVAFLTGYSTSYIGALKADPTFQELLGSYKAEADAVFVDTLERMKSVGLVALEELAERLTLQPELWSKRELMELTELMLGKAGSGQSPRGASNTGGGPSVAVNVKFVSSAPQLDEATPFGESRLPVVDAEIISEGRDA